MPVLYRDLRIDFSKPNRIARAPAEQMTSLYFSVSFFSYCLVWIARARFSRFILLDFSQVSAFPCCCVPWVCGYPRLQSLSNYSVADDFLAWLPGSSINSNFEAKRLGFLPSSPSPLSSELLQKIYAEFFCKFASGLAPAWRRLPWLPGLTQTDFFCREK